MNEEAVIRASDQLSAHTISLRSRPRIPIAARELAESVTSSGQGRDANDNDVLPILDSVSNVRTIHSSLWARTKDELIYTVRGDGFLHHMVRNLVGTFLLVGKGSLKIGDVPTILEARNRSAAGPTAAACGLYLVSVEY